MSNHVHQILNTLSIEDLRHLNREFGLSTTGNQTTLIRRLLVGPTQVGGALLPTELGSIIEIYLNKASEGDPTSLLSLFNMIKTNKPVRERIINDPRFQQAQQISYDTIMKKYLIAYDLFRKRPFDEALVQALKSKEVHQKWADEFGLSKLPDGTVLMRDGSIRAPQ